MHSRLFILAVTAGAIAAPIAAQNPPPPGGARPPMTKPGAPDPKRVEAGSYTVDPNHTQVIWVVDHLGISPLYGAFGNITGTLALDPARLAAAKLSLTIPVNELTTTSAPFTKHLSTADFFDIAKFPSATFVSTAVQPTGGTSARVTGNLTLHGVTKPVTIDAKFHGAGVNGMSKKLTVGFSGTATIKRSDWGLGGGVPMVSDETELKITAAFEKQ